MRGMIAAFVVACGNQSAFFGLRSQIDGDRRQVLILFQSWEIGWGKGSDFGDEISGSVFWVSQRS
jgi:hypothetical protein